MGYPLTAAGQVEAEAVLRGQVLLGESIATEGTVVLHRLSDLSQGEVDSTRVISDGTFSVRLPAVPDPASGDFYFASVRHDGVMYFGGPITTAVQLDSVYRIQAYDTLLAPAGGVPIALAARNLFLEPSGGSWRVTDLFQLRSDLDRTVVPREGGRTWSYPLAEGARDFATEGELSSDVAAFESGELVVRAALPPGERMFVVSYMLDAPELSIPTPGVTELMDVLVREPAPALEIEGLQRTQSVELDPGQTYRRYSGENVSTSTLRVSMGEEIAPPEAHWVAVILALVLTGGALVAFRGAGRRPAAVAADRHAIILELARLDEDFESAGSPTRNARRKYRQRRAELMRRLEPGD